MDNNHEPKRERPSRAEYQRERRKQSVELYFDSPEDLQAFKKLAQTSGYRSFNPWIMQALRDATSGKVYPPEFVDGQAQEIERLRKWLDTSRDENQDYRTQLKQIEGEREALLSLILKFEGGADAASRFLDGVTKGAA